jgi:predicted nucleic acid-binding protein
MTTPTERVLLDTNVLVYAMNQDAEHHESCRRLLDRAVDGQVPA